MCPDCKNGICACKDKNKWCSCEEPDEEYQFDEEGDLVCVYCLNCYGLICVGQRWEED